ncbi:hypothetical protein GQV92_004654 [Salmonella enterica]|nr:hypothetical protein [Salmonella enterica]
MLRSNIIDAAISVEDLITKLGGTGRGLREKTNSISHLLEPSYVKKNQHDSDSS